MVALEMECHKMRSKLLIAIMTLRTSRDIESQLKTSLLNTMNDQLLWMTLFVMALSMYVIVLRRLV